MKKYLNLVLTFFCLPVTINISQAQVGSLDSERADLTNSAIRYQPNAQGFDVRKKKFRDQTMAWLYLSALSEQYSISGLSTVGSIETTQNQYPLHDARHLFYTNSRSAFFLKKWHTVITQMLPDLDYEVRNEILKANSIEKLALVRSELMRAIQENQSTARFEGEIAAIVQNFPGASQLQRQRYLHSVQTASENNPIIQIAIEEARYQARLQMILEGDVQRDETESLFLFWMLQNYFDFETSGEYVLWPKLVHPDRIRSQIGQTIQIEFYLSKRTDFVNNLLEHELPLIILESWMKLQKSGIEVSYQFASVQSFVSRSFHMMSERGRNRYSQLVQALLSMNQSANRINSPIHFSNLFRPGSLSLVLNNGQVLNESQFFRMRILSKAQVESKAFGIEQIIIKDYDHLGNSVISQFARQAVQQSTTTGDQKQSSTETGRIGSLHFSQKRTFHEPDFYAQCRRISNHPAYQERINDEKRKMEEQVAKGDLVAAIRFINEIGGNKYSQYKEIDPDCKRNIDADLRPDLYAPEYSDVNQRIFVQKRGGHQIVSKILLTPSRAGMEFFAKLFQPTLNQKQTTIFE